MSAKWPKVKLGEVLRPVSRVEAVDSSKEYSLIGVRLDGNGAFLREVVSGVETSATTLYRVATGDFIYSRLFAWRGAFDVVINDLDGCYVSGEFPTFIARDKRLDPHFLNYWFRLPETLDRVKEHCSGSTPLTRNRFKERFFLDLEIPLPPLAEQHRIVAWIENIAVQINEARRLRQQAVKDAQDIILSMHARLAGTRTRALGDLVRLDEDHVPISFENAYPQAGVKSFGDGLFAKEAVLGSATTYKTFNRLYAGALVLSQVKGWEGAVAVCPKGLEGMLVSPEYRTFRCIETECRPSYLASIVKTEWFWRRLVNATRGVGARRERVRPEQFLNITLPMPDIEQQKAGESLFGLAETLMSHLSGTIGFDVLLPSILDKAFKGKL